MISTALYRVGYHRLTFDKTTGPKLFKADVFTVISKRLILLARFFFSTKLIWVITTLVVWKGVLERETESEGENVVRWGV